MAAAQAAGLLLGVASWCLQSSCASSQLWRARSRAESATSSRRTFEGLWMSCVATATGSVQCSRFKTLLGLPAHIQACRALMILSLLLGLVAVVAAILGLRCTKIGRMPERVKDRTALSAGILFILSGLLTLTAVSWYAARVVQEFHDPLYGGVRFELGAGLYLGWASTCLALLGGAMLCCSSRRTCSPSPPPARHFSYYSSGSGGPTIYRAAPPSDGSSKSYV